MAEARTAPTVVYLPIEPRTPTPFHGDLYEDVEDWLQHNERVAQHNELTTGQRLQNLYFALEGTARRRFENHEASLTLWDACAAELKRTFKNQHRRQRAEDLLQMRMQGPYESVTSFIEDVLRLSNRTDAHATEYKKLRVLMRGVKNYIFGGLVRNTPTTVDGFVPEATIIERALLARATHYSRHPSVPDRIPSLISGIDCSTPGICEIIRDIVREEIRKLIPAAERPASISIAEVFREEVQRPFEPEAPVYATATEEATVSYAAMARRPPLPARPYVAPPLRDHPAPQYSRRHE